jgi:threonyl-tRNA synthetase
MIQVQLPDGTISEFSDQATAMDVATSIGSRLAAAVVAAEVDGKVADAMRPMAELTEADPIPLKLLTNRDPVALGVLRHSCAHVMARAVMRVFPGVSLAFGPTLDNGFYYDFDLDHKISDEDFPKIEAEMKKIVKDAEPFERFTMLPGKAIELCNDLDQDLKVEHISTGLSEETSLSFYRQGEFVDLCRGPHIPNAGKIKAFKLLSVAGSYWKGDASNKQLQRLYGTAWFSKQDLKQYLEQVEEAKRRDHRVLGKKLRLFTIDPKVGSGLCLWVPKGATIRSLLEGFIQKELLARGYQPVYSPHIGRVELYETSGHFPYYRDSQFAPIYNHDAGQTVDFLIRKLSALLAESEGEAADITTEADEEERKLIAAAELMAFDAARAGYNAEDPPRTRLDKLQAWQRQQERYLLKPMNCPHHVEMYQSQPRSYRELPVRLAEFGTVYRYEQTGELNGMLRVRGLTQDDAHIFCTADQVEGEFRATLDLTKFVLESVGLTDYRVQLSTRDADSAKYVGSSENWERAEKSLLKVLTESQLKFEVCPGEAAFYGPKADFMVRDCLGREWQLGTVQLDYNLPERFGL